MNKNKVLFYSLLMNILVILATIFIWTSYFFHLAWRNLREEQIIMSIPIQEEIPKQSKEVRI